MAMMHNFGTAPQALISRSKFNLSSTHETTLNAGDLIPIHRQEVLPGDTINLRADVFGRLLSPLKTPCFDNIHATIHHFFVPCRLLWDHWINLHGERENPDDSIDYIVPQLIAPPNTGFTEQTLADYFGLPLHIDNISVNALYFRAYNLIYNEWYRDQNLIDSVEVKKDDTNDDMSLYPIRKKAKRPDYFTSCLPSPQKGQPVELAIGSLAPIITTADAEKMLNTDGAPYTPLYWSDATTGSRVTGTTDPSSGQRDSFLDLNNATGETELLSRVYGTGSNPESNGDIIPQNLVADLTREAVITVNQLRMLVQIQRLLERDMRGGTRYIEMNYAHFGVISPDNRLQRPEYLGGDTFNLITNTVVQTSSTVTGDGGSAQGNLAAFSLINGYNRGFVQSFTEHGIIISLLAIHPDIRYQQGIHRDFSRRVRFDYALPVLAHLGEQAVLNKELYAQGSDVLDENGNIIDDLPFGYQERYGEYRYGYKLVSGYLRSTANTPLDIWHLGEKFANLPTLSQDFIEVNPDPIDRICAVQRSSDTPQFLVDCRFNINAVRALPTHGVPGFLDHF